MLSTRTKIKLDLLDFTYMYKEKSWTCCWILSTCTKKKAGYLHANRKKLDLLDVIFITKKKAGLVQVM